MRNILVILNFIACAFVKHSSGIPQDLGSLNVKVRIGNLLPSYYPLEEKDILASEKALKWIQTYLPEYDPYKQDEMAPFGVDSYLGSGFVTASNVEVKGLNGAQFDSLELRMRTPYRMDINVSVPFMQADADIKAPLEILFMNIDVFGHVRMILEGLKISLAISAAPTKVEGREVFQNNAIKVHANVDNIQVTLDLDGIPTDLKNDRAMLLVAVNSMKDEIAKTAAQLVLDKSNELLRHSSRDMVEKYLSSFNK